MTTKTTDATAAVASPEIRAYFAAIGRQGGLASQGKTSPAKRAAARKAAKARWKRRRPPVPLLVEPADPYAPCPCGSGRKFKFCCRPAR